MTVEQGHNLGIWSGWAPGDDGWGARMDINLRRLDGVVMFSTPVAPTNTPPSSPALGDRYILDTAPTGAWAGQGGALAVYQKDETNTSAWQFYPPKEGWYARVLDVTTTILPVDYLYRGGVWVVKEEVASVLGLTGALVLADFLAHGFGTMAEETLPTAGLVYSNGTHVANVTLDSHITLTSGTLALANVATLDVGGANAGRVPLTQLPAALSEAVYFAGSWNATTGTTSLGGVLTSGTGSAGAMFKVATAGTTTIDGVSQWNVGDEVIFSGLSSTWVKLDGIATEVLAVAGQTGNVVFASGLVLSNGTTVSAAVIGAGLTLSVGGTLASTGGVAVPAAGVVTSNGTIFLSSATLGYPYLPTEVQNTPLAVFQSGTMADAQLLLLVAFNQSMLVPSGLANTTIVFNSTADLPAATMTAVVATNQAGTWTTQGTISVTTAGSLSIVAGLTADLTLTAPGALRIVGQATHDAGAKNFGLTLMTKKV